MGIYHHKMADRLELLKRLCAGTEFKREQLIQDMEVIRVGCLRIIFRSYVCLVVPAYA